MRKLSTLPGLVALTALALGLYLGSGTAEAVTCPSGMAQLTSHSAISGASQGGTASVNFTVAAGCNVQLSLVSYKAPSAAFSASTADQQVIFDTATGTFAAGAHSLSVDMPNCLFQVDFIFGSPITTLGPAGSNNFYSAQGRLISGVNGGTTSCAVTAPNTGNTGTGSTGNQTPVTVTVTPTAPITNAVIPAGPITWAPGFGPNGVVASVQTAPTSGATVAPVTAATLPSTSTAGDTKGMLLLGIAAVGMGVVLLRAGRASNA
jgi:hypothetical protein